MKMLLASSARMIAQECIIKRIKSEASLGETKMEISLNEARAIDKEFSKLLLASGYNILMPKIIKLPWYKGGYIRCIGYISW